MGQRAVVTLLQGVGAALLLCACGPEFERVSALETLRVLGVRKDVPYAAPGEQVNLSMLWHDARPESRRTPVTVAWFPSLRASDPGGPFCLNPNGDFYYGCFEELAGDAPGGAPGGTLPPPSTLLPSGDHYSFTMPTNAISDHPAPLDPEFPRYGLAYSFFAVCGGELAWGRPEDQFPLRCLDAAGDPLGSDDFIAGYTGVYSYETLRNTNPIVTGFRFDGVDVAGACVDDACVDTPPEPADCSSPATPCIPHCDDDGEPTCKGWKFQPLVDRASPERDPIAGDGLSEAMWINYFSDGGHVKSDLRLLNDSQKGWNDSYGTEFYAPKKPGTYHLWAVIHDNRGGTAFTRITLAVQ